MEDEEIMGRLQYFGLTRYEAEIYFLLLRYKVLTATKLGELSKVPITRIYDIAQSLIDKGLIGVVNLNPKQYGILPFKASLRNLIHKKKEEFEREIKTLEKEHNNILKCFSNIPNKNVPKTEDFVYTINGRKAILRAWHTVFSNVKKEIFIFSGDSGWLSSEVFRLKKMLNGGADVRLLANCRDLDKMKEVLEIGVNIRLSDNSLRGFVADKKYLYISKKFTSSTKDEDYSCILTEHRSMVDSLREYFLMKWECGREVK